MRTYRHQNQALHLLFDPVLNKPLLARLSVRPGGNRELWQCYATIFVVAVFAGTGG